MFVTKTLEDYKIEIPSLFKGYKVIEEIMTNQFSAIIKVQDVNTNEYFAAKIFPNKEGFLFTDLNRMIKNEIKVLSLINHPNIVKMRETFNLKVKKRQTYIVIIEEYCSTDLHTYVSEEGFKNEEEKRNIIKGIIEGLSFLHKNHIVHRDIKPENILLDDNHIPKICDFNFSEFTHPKYCFTDSKGTKYYSPPELLHIEQLEKSNCYKCDIFSLGVTLFFLSECDLPYIKRGDWGKGKLTIEMDDKSLQKIIKRCTLSESSRRPEAKELLSDKYFDIENEDENLYILKMNAVPRFVSLSVLDEEDDKSSKNESILTKNNRMNTFPRTLKKELYEYSSLSSYSSYFSYSSSSNEKINEVVEKENKSQEIPQMKKIRKKSSKNGKQSIKRKLLISIHNNDFY